MTTMFTTPVSDSATIVADKNYGRRKLVVHNSHSAKNVEIIVADAIEDVASGNGFILRPGAMLDLGALTDPVFAIVDNSSNASQISVFETSD